MRAISGTLIIVLVVIAVMLAIIALQASRYRSEISASNASRGKHGAPTAASTTTGVKIPHGTYIVMLGDPRCPHCRAMERFFKRYSDETGVKTFFCSVLDKACLEAFQKLYRLGATEGVPTIVACRGNRVGFIEVGELEKSGWWSTKLAGMRPVAAGKVPVYIAGNPYKEIEIDKALATELCNTILAYSKPIG